MRGSGLSLGIRRDETVRIPNGEGQVATKYASKALMA